MLSVQGIHAAYGSRIVLHDISFELEAGSVLGLIGPNGAGKSSLVRAISGVLPLQSGRIEVGGPPLESLSPAQRARWLAVVPQARNLPPAFTARELVALGRTPHLNWLGQLSKRDEDVIHSAMQRTDTLTLADRPVGQLSGGEQQRLLIARALAQAAPILLLDEPSAHLDLQYQLSLLDLIMRLAHEDGLAVLLALHDLNLVARYADAVILLVSGRLQASGKPGEVLTPVQIGQAFHVAVQVVTITPGSPPVIIPEFHPEPSALV
jgi:ABC-type cobalamin/Fe3+-siderophores transport system ATPase subunit